jgi:GNAT superfamily N-acetyltransferase
MPSEPSARGSAPPDPVTIAREDPASAAARWCLEHYFAELRERFEEHFDPGLTLPAESDDLVFLLARVGGEPAACGVLKGLQPGVGEIMRMWVAAAYRGMGIGARMLAALEAEAAALGRHTVRLYTNRSLAEAQAMYRTRGYVEIPRYNEDPYANHWFEKQL